MAGKLCVLLVVVIGTVWVGPAKGQSGLCLQMESCSEVFRDKARLVGHDRGPFCRLKKEELSCFQIAVRECLFEQKDFALKQITAAQNEQKRACDATCPLTSVWVLSGAAILAILWNFLPRFHV